MAKNKHLFLSGLLLSLRACSNPTRALYIDITAGAGKVHAHIHSSIHPEHLSVFNVAGSITALAIRESQMLPRQLTRVMLCCLQSGNAETFTLEDLMEDLEQVDAEQYAAFSRLLQHGPSNETSCIDIDTFGATETVDLANNGRSVAVTQADKGEYARPATEYTLIKSVKEQLNAFAAGVHEIVPMELLFHSTRMTWIGLCQGLGKSSGLYALRH